MARTISKIWFLLCMATCGGSECVFAQGVILFHNVMADSSEGNYGPNRKHYSMRIIQLGMHFGATDSAGSDIHPYKSFEAALGLRYKRQLGSFYALGIQADAGYNQFNLQQTNAKIFGGAVQHKREKLMLLQAGISAYQRFNFLLHRGNHLGHFLDMGLYSDFLVIRRYIVHDNIDPVYGYGNHRSSFGKIKWLNYINYGAELRWGISIGYIFARYRLSDMLKNKTLFPWPELPRFTAGVGIQIGKEN